MAKFIAKFGLNHDEKSCSASIEMSAVPFPALEEVWMEVLPNTWPFLCWSSAWSCGLHGVKVNVRGCCSSQAHAYSSVASSVSSAPLVPHPQRSQHDVTPGILWQNAATPQPELLGSCLAPSVHPLCKWFGTSSVHHNTISAGKVLWWLF